MSFTERTTVARPADRTQTPRPARQPASRWSRLGFGAGLFALGLLVLFSVMVAVSLGSVSVPLGEVWAVITGRVLPGGDPAEVSVSHDGIVWELRLPRVLLAAVVGAGLGVVGAVIQAVVRNPLADPYILGSTAGASLGAVLVIVGGLATFGTPSTSLAAFIGAMGATGVLLLFARRHGVVSPLRLILAGVALAAMLSALTNYVVISADDEREVQSALFWLLGTLGGAKWHQLTIPALTLLVCTLILVARSRELDALSIGDETAATLGVNVARLRLQLVVICSLLVGVAVAVSGGIGFVALMIPHVVRLLVGPDHRRLLPVTALVGAIFLVWVDLGARMLLRPEEIPVGVITSLVGGPALLFLLLRREARLREGT